MPFTCIFGGSFDPPHLGHRALAETALACPEIQRLIVMPAAVSPFKTEKRHASDEQRLALCRLTFGDLERVTVSDFEFSLPLPSYTVNTLRALRKTHPADKLALLMGGDAFLSLEQWKDYRELIRVAAIFAAGREHCTPEEILSQKERVEADGGEVHLLKMDKVNVSSTELRRRIEAGLPPDGLVTEKAAEWIRQHRIYD